MRSFFFFVKNINEKQVVPNFIENDCSIGNCSIENFGNSQRKIMKVPLFRPRPASELSEAAIRRCSSK